MPLSTGGAGSISRALWVAGAALLLAGLFSQTSLYPRLMWWLEDSQQRALGAPLPLDHVVVFDVDEESMQRLEPQLGAWPYSRQVYARATRFLAEQGARAVVFDILFSEAREGDDAFAAALDRRSVLAAAALPYPLRRPPAYLEQLKRSALSDAASEPALAALAQPWLDLTLPLPKFASQARTGVISAVADDDGVVRRLAPLHAAYGEILPSLPLAALLAAEPEAVPGASRRELRLGARGWPVSSGGSILLRFPGNADALSVVPFFQLVGAAAGAPGTAHIGELIRDKIVFVGSSSAVLGDFAFTPVGRLPGLQINALMTEMLIENQVRRPAAWWVDLLLLALALALPAAMVTRDAVARPRDFVLGLPAIVAVVAGAGMALFALNQHSHWLFAALTGVAAQAFALSAWLFALYRERQRLFYEKMAAQEANRMKSEFLAHMTHELRTPVTAIMGFNKINQLTDDLGREQRVRNSATIGRNCDHLLALVNNNLDLARIEAGQLEIEPKPEDIAALLDEVASTLGVMAEQKGLILERLVTGPMPAALSLDGFRLRQVLINLLGNAVKFTERGTVALEAQWRAGELQLSVRDTGPGIPAESLERVFEPFQRVATSRVAGTGLGLAITRKLVTLMGGTIIARSAAGAGSTFEVRIPAAEIRPAATQRLEPPVAVQAALAGRVLVAEDNESLRELIELQLRELGLHCHLVNNGFEAVAAASADRFDVVLMDMDMPLMDGYEAVNVLRERGYERPIIAFTAYRDGAARERAVREGCDGVVGKPVTIEGLRGALEPLLCR